MGRQFVRLSMDPLFTWSAPCHAQVKPVDSRAADPPGIDGECQDAVWIRPRKAMTRDAIASLYITLKVSGRVDVQTSGNRRDGNCSIELIRAFRTRHPDGVQFDTKRECLDGVCRCEMASGRPDSNQRAPLCGLGTMAQHLIFSVGR